MSTPYGSRDARRTSERSDRPAAEPDNYDNPDSQRQRSGDAWRKPARDMVGDGSADNDARRRSNAVRGSDARTPEQTNEMIVLGVMHRGARTFGQIQKMTRMPDSVLNNVLETLEKQKMLRVVQKQGFFGTRVEMHPSDDRPGRFST